MSNEKNLALGSLSCQLQSIAAVTHDAAYACEGNVLALLALLRQLERLHREIRDGVFQESLPENRHQLYSLLKDIESEGGWPYIERMKLRALLTNLLQEATEEISELKDRNDLLGSDHSFNW